MRIKNYTKKKSYIKNTFLFFHKIYKLLYITLSIILSPLNGKKVQEKMIPNHKNLFYLYLFYSKLF